MKYKKDIFWNYLSLVIMAIAGLVINAIIIRFYDSSALGIYNETYAWYMILSQISVWGIHMAVVKIVPENESNEERENILKSALMAVSTVSMCITILVGIVMCFLKFEWRPSLYRALLGLVFFSINKVLFNYLNAIEKMTVYAILQSLRYILLMVVIFVISVIGMSRENLAFTFPVTEIIVMLCLISYFAIKIKPSGKVDYKLQKKIIGFGSRIMPSNMVLEMNTKVDVICLGLFIKNTAQIGVYSFAILFTEGLYQLFVIIRKIINPSLSKNSSVNRLQTYLDDLGKLIRKYMYVSSFIVYLVILMLYVFICRIYAGEEYYQGICYIAIIGISIVLTGKQIVLGDILAQTGFPLEESKLNAIAVCANAILNILLINIWGIIGAAVATSLSYIFFAILLKKTVKSIIDLGI